MDRVWFGHHRRATAHGAARVLHLRRALPGVVSMQSDRCSTHETRCVARIKLIYANAPRVPTAHVLGLLAWVGGHGAPQQAHARPARSRPVLLLMRQT